MLLDGIGSVDSAIQVEAMKSKILISAMIRWCVVVSFCTDLLMRYKMRSEQQADSAPIVTDTMKPPVVMAKNGFSSSVFVMTDVKRLALILSLKE
jgi:hypothetical protein